MKFPTYIEDAAAAIGWIHQNVGQYGGDRQSLFISGHSAGGYITLMVVLDERYLQHHGINANHIAGIIPVSGQTFTHTTIREEKGIDNPRSTPLIDGASPCFRARSGLPPVLIACAEHDAKLRKLNT